MKKLEELRAVEKFRVLAMANYLAEKENTLTYADNDRWAKDGKWRNEKIEGKIIEALNKLY